MSERSEDEDWAREVLAALPACPTCTRCSDPPMSSSYRWNGERWEHRCADIEPQAGHFPIEDDDAFKLRIMSLPRGPRHGTPACDCLVCICDRYAKALQTSFGLPRDALLGRMPGGFER